MLNIDLQLSQKIQTAAQEAGLSVEAYLEHLMDQPDIEFAPILQQLPDVIYTFDFLTRTVEFINRDSFLGYSLDELTQPQSLFSKLLPDDMDRLTKYWTNINDGGVSESEAVTFQLKDADNQWRWIKMRHVVLTRDSEQKARKLLIHLTDVTDIKTAERLAFENEQRLQTMFAAMSEGLVFHRSDGVIETCNKSAQKILGLSMDQMIGRSPLDPRWRAIRKDGTPFPGEEHPAMVTLRTGESAENVIMGVYKPDGKLTWISINTEPLFQDSGTTLPYAVVATFTDITQQVEQETQLRVLMQAVEQSPISVVITDTDANITYVNTQFTSLTGYLLEEVIGENPRILQSGMTPREAFADLWETLARGKVWRGEMINRKKNGEIYYELAIISPIKDAHGETTHYVAVKEDITARKQFEEALQESERVAREFQEHLKTLHDMSLELANVDSLNDLYRRSVEAGTQALGFDRVALFLIDHQTEAVRGTYGTDPQGKIRPEFDYESSLHMQAHWVNEVLRNKERVMLWEESPLIDYDKQVGQGWNAMAGLWDGDNAIGFFAVDNHLTSRPPRSYERELLSWYGKTVGHLVARLRSLHALRQSEQRVRKLLEHAPTCILVAELNGIVESANQQTASLLGYDRVDQLYGRDIHHLLPDLPPAEELSTLRTLHLGLKHDLFATRQDASTLPVDLVMTRLTLQEVPRLVFFMSDLSYHNELEEQRLQLAIETERSEVLAKFIRDASHEFRTPLTVIKNRSFLIQVATDEEKVKQNVSKIDTQVDRIVSLVEDLAYIAQLDSMTEMVLEEHYIIDVLKSAIREFQTDLDHKNITLTFSSSYQIPKVRCHVHELKEALVRIINNAIRYNFPGGHIKISCLQQVDHVIIDIEDSGIGIDADYLPHIFKRFYRMDTAHTTQGFGLGLAIAQKIVFLHHGTIGAESELGKGTTIRIQLPIQANSHKIH